jgi:hypothetical protein
MESPIFSRTHRRTDETKAELMKDFFLALILGREDKPETLTNCFFTFKIIQPVLHP